MTRHHRPKADSHFFSLQGDAELSQDEPYQFSVPIFGPNVVYGADLAHRNQQLKFIAASLSTKALQSYVPLIVKEAEDFFAKWDKSGVRRPTSSLAFAPLRHRAHHETGRTDR